MKMLDIPTYEMKLTDDADGLLCMGLVDDPAIMRNFLLLTENHPIELKKDSARQVIFGPAIIPSQPIYRRDESGEYYIVFSREVIEQMVEKWSRNKLTNQVNIMHDHDRFVDQCTLVELFVKDAARGLNPTGYEDLPDGTLFVAYKVEKSLWEAIESGEVDLKGFSIEAVMGFERKKENEIDLMVDEVLNDVEMASNFDYYTAGEIEDMMKANKVYDIKVDGKIVNCQIYAITDDGSGIEVMTADKPDGKNQWINIKIGDIESIKVTNDPYLPWETDTQSFKDYLNDSHTVTRSIVAPPVTIDDYIKQRTMVMINYNDDKENPHTSARQCAIIARGLTSRGNSCVRVYQFFGDSRSIAEGYAERPLGDYRLMLEKRITQIRPMPFAEPWEPDDLDLGLLNQSGDNGMKVLYTHYSDFV